MRFTALETFYSQETESEYVAGLSYTIHDRDELLAIWRDEGRISFGGPKSRMNGHGTVSWL